jgi:hypothetical protein
MLKQFLACSRSYSQVALKILLVGATVLLMPTARSGQLVTGSIVVLQSVGDYLVIAADSKGVSQKGASYDRCKIVALDNRLVYAATGHTSRADASQIVGTWGASAVARQAYLSLAKNPEHELIPKLADSFGASLAFGSISRWRATRRKAGLPYSQRLCLPGSTRTVSGPSFRLT